MKKCINYFTAAIMLCFFHAVSNAQQSSNTEIMPVNIWLSTFKTTNLIFPFAIKSIDKGSNDVLVQKASGVENVLQLKAATEAFEETNLSVVTADGSFFSYLLNYGQSPSEINIKVERMVSEPKPLAVFAEDATSDIIQLNAEKVFSKNQTMKKKLQQNNGAFIDLKGLYGAEQYLYFQFRLGNLSPLDYRIKTVRLFIRDRKKSKRTASQEIDVEPVYLRGNVKIVRSNSEQVVVVAVPAFTIPDKKVFIIQMQEENGGRNLQLNISNKQIFKCLTIH